MLQVIANPLAFTRPIPVEFLISSFCLLVRHQLYLPYQAGLNDLRGRPPFLVANRICRYLGIQARIEVMLKLSQPKAL